MARSNTGTVVGIVVGIVGVGASAGAFIYAKKKIDEIDAKKDDGTTDPTDPGGGVPSDPWTPEPYERYQRKGYTVDLTGLQGGVRWRVWATTEPPTVEPAASQVMQSKLEDSDEEARVAANAFIDALAEEGGYTVVPGLPVPTPDPPPIEGQDAGGVWTPVPDPPKYVVADLSGMFGEKGPGIFASKDCSQIWISNAVDWVSWASPKILANKEMDPIELTAMLLEEALPGCEFDFATVKIAGSKPLLDQIAAADDAVLEKWRNGISIATIEPQAAPAEVAAALLIGTNPIPHMRPAFPYRGHHVTITKLSNNGWRWKAWKGTRKQGAPNYQGFALGADKAASDAMKKISQELGSGDGEAEPDPDPVVQVDLGPDAPELKQHVDDDGLTWWIVTTLKPVMLDSGPAQESTWRVWGPNTKVVGAPAGEGKTGSRPASWAAAEDWIDDA